MLTAAVEELDSLLNLSGRVSGLDAELEVDLHRCKEALDRIQKELIEKNEDLKTRGELIQNLTGKVSTCLGTSKVLVNFNVGRSYSR